MFQQMRVAAQERPLAVSWALAAACAFALAYPKLDPAYAGLGVLIVAVASLALVLHSIGVPGLMKSIVQGGIAGFIVGALALSLL